MDLIVMCVFCLMTLIIYAKHNSNSLLNLTSVVPVLVLVQDSIQFLKGNHSYVYQKCVHRAMLVELNVKSLLHWI
jgi:hypothetical protein